jgi:putative redox protein
MTIHAEDCADCETKTGKIDQIDREITLQGPLSDEQCQRLLEIANRCPVHRTLTSDQRLASIAAWWTSGLSHLISWVLATVGGWG